MNIDMALNWKKEFKKNANYRENLNSKMMRMKWREKWKVLSPNSNKTSVSSKSQDLKTSSSLKTNLKKDSWTKKSPSLMQDLISANKTRKFIILRSSLQSHWPGSRKTTLKNIRIASTKFKQKRLNKERSKIIKSKVQSTLS